MGDAEVPPEPRVLPAAVVDGVQDALIGMRTRTSFGSRVFWGSVVSCYWVSGGCFYKVSFDDGDVDLFSADEVLQDVAAAKRHAKENPQALQEEQGSTCEPANETTGDDYVTLMRHHSLKRKREDGAGVTASRTRRVRLWGQRLYASIYTNRQNETFIKKLIKTEEGETGEMEATGEVKVGDMIVAVDGTRVLGMTSRDLAALIRKPRRPITLTFYRPQGPAVLAQQQENPTTTRDKQPVASSALATVTAAEAQTQPIQQNLTQAQFVSSIPLASATPVTQTVASTPALVPPSYAVPQQSLTRPSSIVQKMAAQWIQQTCMSQAYDLSSSKELILQRLSQIAAARQAGYLLGYPPGMFMHGNVLSTGAVPVANGSTTQSHPMCSATQRVTTTVPLTPTPDIRTHAAQDTRPMYQAGVTTSVNQPYRNQEQGWQQHDGRMARAQVQQVQTVPGPTGHSNERILSNPTTEANAMTNEMPVPEAVSKQMEQESTTSRQSFDQEVVSNRKSAEDISRESLSSTSNSESSASIVGAKTLVVQDTEASATLDDKCLQAAEHGMDVSTDTSLPLSTDVPEDEEMDDGTLCVPASTLADESRLTVKAEVSASTSMSFLSPSDFSSESSVLPHQLSAGSAPAPSAKVESSAGLVSVKVYRRRLCLTLGVQGTLIAVTSFVSDDCGQPGEVEASGRVFIGDVLMRVNGTFIVPGLTPGHVANIVTCSPRPVTLWFKRASWDILDGKA
ncbi:unnamed protein product [Hyaloperonospora brassicae]|uniref:PDZ domain-containing protein n=1 Tax=Hyaloperonospora brassicae TaxID=162125 RepID=A0AAV0U5T3_HYABA|nr:unnamed protein product [Hyaloperonospora brassicae]